MAVRLWQLGVAGQGRHRCERARRWPSERIVYQVPWFAPVVESWFSRPDRQASLEGKAPTGAFDRFKTPTIARLATYNPAFIRTTPSRAMSSVNAFDCSKIHASSIWASSRRKSPPVPPLDSDL